ncbi:MAG: NAD(P)H-binding protein [Verrucomicrobiota bacterium]
MKSKEQNQESRNELTLVLGATGKTGSRVASRLTALGKTIRKGSRRTIPAFDWNREASWDASLEGVTSVYISYAGDLAIDGSTDTIQAFVNKAKSHGVRHLVLLSGRGEEEAQACERIVQESGLDWTIVRGSWFNQNFSNRTTPVGKWRVA